jgi:DNA ligase-1
MRYLIVAEAYRDLEQASGRLVLIERMAELVTQTPAELLPTVCYLCQGQIAPEFAGIDLGLAEKMAIRALAAATGTEPAHVAARVREAGDLGQAAEQLLAETGPGEAAPGEAAPGEAAPGAAAPGETGAGRPASLDVSTVVRTLRQIAAAEGQGSQGRKLELLAGLLGQATPLEARYLLRLVTGNLRLGIGTPTILDALAQVYAGGRPQRKVLERGYNICCDIGLVAATLVGGGLTAVEKLHVQPGNPVRAMLAQRLSDAAEILAKLGGRCSAEYKYDGVRVQAHRTADGQIELVTRRLEEISTQFPDVVEVLQAGLGPREAILEGEVVAYDAATDELRPFGEVMLRRRKYGIEKAMQDVPVGLFCFELLYADGEDLTMLPYPERRARLAAAITPGPRLRLTTATEVDEPAALDAAFSQAVTDGCEGLVCKSVGPESVYQAGARGWQWIKLKRDYRTELSDTVDLVVIGAYAGRGRRTGVYGAVLLAAYDADADMFRAVSKCGAGFTDADLATLHARLAPLVRPDKPARVDARQAPDVWCEPGLVLEILSAELTLSPNNTAAWGQIEDDAGLAMRFPRFTGRWRDDKSPEDATTTRELIDLFLGANRVKQT